jgi:hypothetical protein
MSLRAMKTYLAARLTDSLSIRPSSFPRSATAGLMYSTGLTTSNITILVDKPSKSISFGTRAVLIIDVVDQKQDQITGGGPSGQINKIYSVYFVLLWNADFTGNVDTITPPIYTTEAAASTDFDAITDAMERTLNAIPFLEISAGVFQGGNPILTDPHTGLTTRMVGKMPRVETAQDFPAKGENEFDLRYSAIFKCDFQEVYQAFTPF